MGSPFNTDESPPLHLGRDVTMVNGRTFAISDAVGAITRPTQGVVFEDFRVLSRLEVALDGRSLSDHELLAATLPTPFTSICVSRTPIEIGQGPADRKFLIIQRRWVGRGIRHDIEVRNTSHERQRTTIHMTVGTDFAHLFDMKAGTASGDPMRMGATEDGLRLLGPNGSTHVEIRFSRSPDDVRPEEHEVTWTVDIDGGASTTVSFSAEPVIDGAKAGLLFDLGQAPADAIPLRRLEAWRNRVPAVAGKDPSVGLVTRTALEDLASLRIFDIGHPDRIVVAAGAPWFMTLFGRDSLLTSWMTLPFAPDIANGVLHALAELQGQIDDPASEEQPGKILHELRRRGGAGPFADRERYYGTIDATPLFLMVVAEAARWGAVDAGELSDLWPSVTAAADWVLREIRDGPGGFIAYQRRGNDGLQNQGWKDSWDGVNRRDGTMASGPIALAEVQGYAFAGLRAIASLARSSGLPGCDADELDSTAAALRDRFNQAFWLPDSGYFAIGVDEELAAIDALTTNPGHALWAGIAEPAKADAHLDHLLGSDLWTGWGLRTLGASMGAYDPLSYHNGSVWPHDTAICAAGAAAYGRWEVVDAIAGALLDAAMEFEGRPPELFAGISRDDVPVPVAYPASCSPQAWSSAAMLLLLRTVIGMEPPASPGEPPLVRRTPSGRLGSLDLEGICVDGARYSIRTAGDLVTIEADTD